MIASFEISNADSVGVKKSTLVEKIRKCKIDFNSSSRRNYNLGYILLKIESHFW